MNIAVLKVKCSKMLLPFSGEPLASAPPRSPEARR